MEAGGAFFVRCLLLSRTIVTQSRIICADKKPTDLKSERTDCHVRPVPSESSYPHLRTSHYNSKYYLSLLEHTWRTPSSSLHLSNTLIVTLLLLHLYSTTKPHYPHTCVLYIDTHHGGKAHRGLCYLGHNPKSLCGYRFAGG